MRWLRWLAVRLLGGLGVIWAVITLCFLAIHLITDDPVQAVLGGGGSQASAESVAQARAQYGLDQPLIVQYLIQLGNIARLDFGTSYAQKSEVTDLLAANLGGTLQLAAAAIILAWALAVAVATVSATAGRWASWAGSALEITAAALPHFWLGTILVLVFSTALGWLPSVSTSSMSGSILPIITLAIPVAGFLGQVIRESLQQALTSPFAMSARMRGETESGVLWRHGIRHAIIPGLEVTSWAFGYLIGGAVVVESVFARPGIGRLLLNAVRLRDTPVVIGVVVVIATIYVIVLAASDAIVAILDPRTRQLGAAR